MTLQQLLTTSPNLHAEYDALSGDEKDAILRQHLQAKAEKNDVIKNRSNTAISRAVDSKVDVITAIVRVFFGDYSTMLTWSCYSVRTLIANGTQSYCSFSAEGT